MEPRELKEAGFSDKQVRDFERLRELVRETGGGEVFGALSKLERARLGFLRWRLETGQVEP